MGHFLISAGERERERERLDVRATLGALCLSSPFSFLDYLIFMLSPLFLLLLFSPWSQHVLFLRERGGRIATFGVCGWKVKQVVQSQRLVCVRICACVSA